MKRIIVLTFLLRSLHPSFGQTSKSGDELSSLIKLDLGLQGIGLTYEPGLSNKMTADISAGTSGGYDITEGSLSYNIEFFRPAFYFSLTPKYFYNRQARIFKGKKPTLNSGNYIGLRLKYVTPNGRQSDFTRNTILVNAHWGIQRAIGNHWTFNFHIGAGYARNIDFDFGTIYPAIDFKFSYIISNSEK
jgi:hypothetical protein